MFEKLIFYKFQKFWALQKLSAVVFHIRKLLRNLLAAKAHAAILSSLGVKMNTIVLIFITICNHNYSIVWLAERQNCKKSMAFWKNYISSFSKTWCINFYAFSDAITINTHNNCRHINVFSWTYFLAKNLVSSAKIVYYCGKDTSWE